MPTQVVNVLIEKVDALTAHMAELKTDVAWLKKTCANSADVTWLKKGVYLVAGGLLSAAANYFVR